MCTQKDVCKSASASQDHVLEVPADSCEYFTLIKVHFV